MVKGYKVVNTQESNATILQLCFTQKHQFPITWRPLIIIRGRKLKKK